MSKGYKNKLVCIEWLDHCNYSTSIWRATDEYKELKPLTVQTVGWVVKETKKHIIVVSTLYPEGDKAFGDMCIIKSSINFIKPLGNSKK